jgi:hypothetical protein
MHYLTVYLLSLRTGEWKVSRDATRVPKHRQVGPGQQGDADRCVSRQPRLELSPYAYEINDFTGNER